MQSLQSLLGRDVATLIFRHLHQMHMQELVAEYHRCLGPSDFLNFFCMKLPGAKGTLYASYNYRKFPAARSRYSGVYNKDCRFVANLPPNY